MIWVVMAAAGGIGSVARVLVSGAVAIRFGSDRGTDAVNIAGTGVLAILVSRASPDVAFVLGIGFLGGFTTFSTWMLDALHTARTRGVAAAYRRIAVVTAAAVALAWLLVR